MKKNIIKFGNFIFRWRDLIFTLIFLPAFYLVTLPELTCGGKNTDTASFIAGFLTVLSGITVRGFTVASGFVKRSGVQRKIHAEGVVRSGLFAHTRNPLYLSNFVIITGVMLCLNLTFYYSVFLPLFYAIYYSITIAEEDYLISKFGEDYKNYIKTVNRYIPGNLSHIKESFSEVELSFKRFLKREYGSTALLISSLIIIYQIKFHHQHGLDFMAAENIAAWIFSAALILLHVIIQILTKYDLLVLDVKEPLH